MKLYYCLTAAMASRTNDDYSNIFNNSYTAQSYHQISLTYREKMSKKFALGIKLSGLLGIQYQQLQIDQSHITFDRANDAADITLRGRYRITIHRAILPNTIFCHLSKAPGQL
jgi:hypothetical protein